MNCALGERPKNEKPYLYPMKQAILLLFSTLLLSSLSAQTFTVQGTALDKNTKAPLVSATVQLKHLKDSTQAIATCDDKGKFKIENLRRGRYAMAITYLGYETRRDTLPLFRESLDLGEILMSEEGLNIEGVVVEGKTPTAAQKGDTLELNAKAFKTNPDANAEDLVQKMPGIQVENDGKVKAQGEDVKQVTVDGKPFMGSDPTAALRNLPADMIDKVQIFDQLSEQAAFSGFDDGSGTKTLNIVTRPEMRDGVFGKVYGGYGYEDKYQAGGTLNYFNKARRITILAQSNNINQQNFAMEDLLGVLGTGGQGMRGGGGMRGDGPPGGGGPRGGGGGGGGGNQGGSDVSDFLVRQSTGIATTHAAGLNYSDKWGKKVSVVGSYFFNYSNNDATQDLNREFVLAQDSGQTYIENNLTNGRNINHRFNFQLTYNIDSLNSIIFKPRGSLQQNKGTSQVDGSSARLALPLNQTANHFVADLLGYNASADFLFRHKFMKHRRTFSLNFNGSMNGNSGDNALESENQYFENLPVIITLDQASDLLTSGWGASTNATFTEPIKDNGAMLFTYAASFQKNEADRRTYNLFGLQHEVSILDSTLSNTFDRDYMNQQGAVGYRHQTRKVQFTVQAMYQYAIQHNDQTFPQEGTIQREFHNVLPSATFRYNFSQSSNLRVNYRTQTTLPAIEQLQNVVNNTNPLQLTTGNPNLGQGYRHSLSVRYSETIPAKSITLFAMLGGDANTNYIGNSTLVVSSDTMLAPGLVLFRGGQWKQPVNLGGQYSLRSFVNYGFPVKALKSNVNLNLSGNYSRTPGLINMATNYSSTQTLGAGVVLSSNISQKVDFTISSNSLLNWAQNTLQPELDNSFFTLTSRGKFNWKFWKGFVFETNVAHFYYTGNTNGYDQNTILWNASLAYKLFKKEQGEIKLSVFDILGQNIDIQRNITDYYIEHTRTSLLTRYVMLTLTYNIKNYKS